MRSNDCGHVDRRRGHCSPEQQPW